MKSSAVRRLYVYSFLDDCIFIYPLYQLMFMDKGLSLGQISWLFVIWSAVSIAAEVPTGLLADRFSRKSMLAAGQLIRAVGFGLWLVWPTFWGFAIGFALWGIGGAFQSGTFQALLYDELDLIGRKADYVRVRGRTESLFLAGELASAAGAALLVGLGYGNILGLSILVVLAAAGLALSIPEAPRQESTGEAGYWHEVRVGLSESLRQPALLKLMLLGGFIGAMYGALEEYTPIFFRAAGAPTQAVPILVAMLTLTAVGASIIAHRFEGLRSRIFMLILLASGACLLGAGGISGIAGVALMTAFYFSIKLLEVIFDGKLQHQITGKLRATITSVGGFATEIISIGTYLLFGWLSDAYNVMTAFSVFGVIMMLVAALYLMLGRRLFAPVVK